MVVAVLLLHQTCDAITNTNNQTCPPSSCGKIKNITHPFRVMNDPRNCGDQKYELSCENNITVLTLFSGKYYVQEINYVNYTIRLVDPGIQEGNCSSIPCYFLTASNFTSSFIDINRGGPYQIDSYFGYWYILYLKCSKAVNDDPEYVDTAPCINSDSKSYLYAFVAGHDFYVGRLKDYCQVKVVAMSSSYLPKVSDNLSYEEIHGILLYGFELSWISGACKELCSDNQLCDLNYDIIGDFKCSPPEYCPYPFDGSGNCSKKCIFTI